MALAKHQTTLDYRLYVARKRETETGQRQYVVWDESRNTWVIDERMPLAGVEWYTSDGVRHG